VKIKPWKKRTKEEKKASIKKNKKIGYKKWSKMDKEEQMEARNINIVVCPQCGKAVLMPFVKEVIACGCGYRKPKNVK